MLSIEKPSQVLEQLPQFDAFQHSFLQELANQFRSVDTFAQYQSWSDEGLIKRLVIVPDQKAVSSENFNLDSLNQLLIHAFYNTLGAAIEKRTGHSTKTFVQLKGKEFSSAVIFCGGVLVLYSLFLGYRSPKFLTIQELIESADTYISHAVTKANQYLDCVN